MEDVREMRMAQEARRKDPRAKSPAASLHGGSSHLFLTSQEEVRPRQGLRQILPNLPSLDALSAVLCIP